MNIREVSGLALIALAIAMAPFGYWVGMGWTALALIPLVLGSVLVYTARVAKKLEDPLALRHPGGPDVPHGLHDLKGFHGGRVLGRGGDAAADDD